jgi:hypothetical protein
VSRVIWKYPLTRPEMLLDVPEAGFMEPGIVRAVAWQHENPTLWIEVDPDKEPKPRRFNVVGTGDRFDPGDRYDPDGALYVGSAISNDLVFHVYEVRRFDPEPIADREAE